MYPVDINVIKSILIEHADQILLKAFGHSSSTFKSDGSLVTPADLQMNTAICDALSEHWPNIGFLSEEQTLLEQQQWQDKKDATFWILDPLDGTTNFAAGIPFFAVSLALYHAGAIELGVVYDPVRKECFSASRHGGAYFNEQEISISATDAVEGRRVALIDFKRLEPKLVKRFLVKPPYASQRNFGAVALEWCWLALGRGHLYLHGKQKIWDYAAGQLILSEAGGKAKTLENTAIDIRRLASVGVIAAYNDILFREWSEWVFGG